jgi:hypothetical protein
MKLPTASCRVLQQKLNDSGVFAKFVKQIEAISKPTMGRGLLRDKTPRNDFPCHCVLSVLERPSKNCVKKIRNEGVEIPSDSPLQRGGPNVPSLM